MPHFNVTTDVIVGFPGETDRHWYQGLDFIRDIGFSHIHIFPYSPRDGTAAASMPDQVSHEIKRERCRQMHRLALDLKREYLERQRGIVFPVLFESCRHERANKVGFCSGYTPNYVRVLMPHSRGDDEIINQIMEVKITGLTPEGEGVMAEPEG